MSRPEPKFAVGEQVMWVDSEGRIISSCETISEISWFSGSDVIMFGMSFPSAWQYRLPTADTAHYKPIIVETHLRRRPPPSSETWEEMRESLKTREQDKA